MPPSRGKQNHLLRRWMFFIEGKLVKLVFIRTLKTMLVIAFFVVCGVIDELTIEGVLKGIFIAVYAHKVGFAVWTVIIFGLIGIYELIKNKKTIRTTLYLLVSSSILILFSMDELIAKNNDINNNPLMKPILAVTVIRDANGLTEKDLNISYFANRGVKYITLTHSKHNQMGDSSGENKPKWNGLSPFGQLAVIEMQKKGVMIDVSHVADSTYYQVLDLVNVPVIASHSSCRKLTSDYERNMTDDMLRALAKNGGVIQINFGAAFLKPEYKDLNDKLWITYEKYLEKHNIADFSGKAAAYLDHWQSVIKLGSVRDLVDHIDHAVKVAGIDHVGLGSDFDGVIPTPTDVPDVSGYPKVVAELLKRGYSETDIQKILSGNILRVWKEVELYSNEHT